jgi:hypothetical protein
VSSTPLFAQRGGRAEALQNYLGLNRNPRLLLQIKIDKNRVCFRASDLRKKTRSVVTISDPATPHKYEGVSIEQLIDSRQSIESRVRKPRSILRPQEEGDLSVRER